MILESIVFKEFLKIITSDDGNDDEYDDDDLLVLQFRALNKEMWLIIWRNQEHSTESDGPALQE